MAEEKLNPRDQELKEQLEDLGRALELKRQESLAGVLGSRYDRMPTGLQKVTQIGSRLGGSFSGQLGGKIGFYGERGGPGFAFSVVETGVRVSGGAETGGGFIRATGPLKDLSMGGPGFESGAEGLIYRGWGGAIGGNANLNAAASFGLLVGQTRGGKDFGLTSFNASAGAEVGAGIGAAHMEGAYFNWKTRTGVMVSAGTSAFG